MAEINEMERWLNESIQHLIQGISSCLLTNPFLGAAYVTKRERERRTAFRNQRNRAKIEGIVEAVRDEIEI